MWLKDHYYKVLTRRVSDGCSVFRIVLLPDCEVYRGHFPGHPVCPGAFNIQMMKECAMEVLKAKCIAYPHRLLMPFDGSGFTLHLYGT